MTTEPIDWVLIDDDFTGHGKKTVGAVGFLAGEAVLVVSFFDDNDANYDGKVSWGEWGVAKMSPIGLKNMKVTRVAMIARLDERILERDAGFNEMAMNLYLNFARNAILDGIYAVYMKRGISSAAGSVSSALISNGIKAYVVKKGMESAIKKAYDAAAN